MIGCPRLNACIRICRGKKRRQILSRLQKLPSTPSTPPTSAKCRDMMVTAGLQPHERSVDRGFATGNAESRSRYPLGRKGKGVCNFSTNQKTAGSTMIDTSDATYLVCSTRDRREIYHRAICLSAQQLPSCLRRISILLVYYLPMFPEW